jgi:adenylate cyclase
MGTEIERKFLVTSDEYRTVQPVHIRQGYLCTDKEHIVRIRISDERALLTVKGLTTGATRKEFEYEIPSTDAVQLLDLCEQPIIEKERYSVGRNGKTWEVDVFKGANEGLVTAELEIEHEDEVIDKPAWAGDEVTDDPRYFNSNLVRHPYTEWA